MKTYQDGEIYFIRESEYGTGKPSPFVKIGLVHYRENRDSFGRLSEHQTGNPRKLLLDTKQVVKTQAVDMVEAQLHRRFSEQRISGEWFEFNDDKSLEVAVNEAQKLANEVIGLMPLFKEAMELDQIVSNTDSRPATSEEIAIATRVVIARKQLVKCKAVAQVRDDLITKAYNEGSDVSMVAKPSVRNYSPKFLEDEFKVENEKLWNKYQGFEETWQHTFTLDRKIKPDSLGEDFEAKILYVESILESVSKGGDFADLVEVTLALKNLEGIAQWEDKVFTARLKLAIGKLDKLEGACTWKRYWDKKTKFDSSRFAEENPVLAKKYVSTPEPTKSLRAKKGKTQ